MSGSVMRMLDGLRVRERFQTRAAELELPEQLCLWASGSRAQGFGISSLSKTMAITGSNTLSQPNHSMNSSVLLCLLPDRKGTPTRWCAASGELFDGLGLALL
ncbi:hypothetical protein BM221_006287 [Beauveria bassiana]|uniref:Uncharacterized protein n=1 Tax=Beauveria bassiana TaxID=176275 RepID=A0A2N6NLF6_BEABA|nr:hypothetical protein BM221_006287 [Beauveria bassiana]